MSFERLAIHYSWMERAFAGSLMQKCRTAFLSRTLTCKRALLVGEGTGKFLTELLRLNPQIQITCVEQSSKMIERIRCRVAGAGLDDSRVNYQAADVLAWTPPRMEFDLIVTHFFLDCFRPGQLQKIIPALAGAAAENAVWLLADFRVPEHGWRRLRALVILSLLYFFFKLTTSLPASRLTSPDAMLEASGFQLEERNLLDFGFAHSDLWRRTSGTRRLSAITELEPPANTPGVSAGWRCS